MRGGIENRQLCEEFAHLGVVGAVLGHCLCERTRRGGGWGCKLEEGGEGKVKIRKPKKKEERRCSYRLCITEGEEERQIPVDSIKSGEWGGAFRLHTPESVVAIEGKLSGTRWGVQPRLPVLSLRNH